VVGICAPRCGRPPTVLTATDNARSDTATGARSLRAGMFAFLYAFAAFYLAQTWLLPVLDPSNVDGLIGGDPQYYHHLALRTAEAMRAHSWTAWEPRPDGQGIAGIGGLAYYWFGPSPQIFALLNAVLHGVSAAVLWVFAERVAGRALAKYAVVPVVIAPYQMAWFSQPNKDSFVMTGALLYFLGLYLLLGRGEVQRRSGVLLALSAMTLGVALVALMRPYLVDILLIASTGVMVLLGLYLVLNRNARETGQRRSAFRVVALVVVANLLLLGVNGATKSAASDLTIENLGQTDMRERYPEWEASQWMPVWLDERLFVIAYQRLHFAGIADSLNATSRDFLVEWDRRFEGAADFLAYLPRAVQLGFLAPFPHDWGAFSEARGSVFRNVVQVEMLFTYVALAALLWAMFSRGLSAAVAAPLAIAAIVIAMYGMATPHVGALNRYRYPFLGFVTCVGLAHLAAMIRTRRPATGVERSMQ
jgi:hypothetical protein